MTGDPALVIEAHAAKAAEFAAAEQFEAAGVATARLRAFLSAAATAQQLLPLANCPELVAAKPAPGGGWEINIVKYGKLANVGVALPHDDIPTKVRALRASAEYVTPSTAPVPGGLPEEARLILNWLDGSDVRLIHCETPWALPVKSALAHVDLSEVSTAITNANLEKTQALAA
jgi:DNA polymerase-3 subunit epsilon